MQTIIQTQPAPTPLPSTWARAIANSITAEFKRVESPRKRYGWQRAKSLRAHHVTGSPPGHTIKTTATIPRTPLLANTEVIDDALFLRATIAPEDNPGLNLPPIAWLLPQLDAVGALADRPDLIAPLNNLMRGNRWGLPYQPQLNRHGRPTLRPSEHATAEEREAVTLLAGAAQIVTLDELDYADWMHEGFNAELTLQLLKQALA